MVGLMKKLDVYINILIYLWLFGVVLANYKNEYLKSITNGETMKERFMFLAAE